MLQRCNNPNDPAYKNYGGRGVTVCARWDPLKGGSYKNFIEDMGYRPSNKHHLDKEAIDIFNTVYCREKCRWVHRSENYRRRTQKYQLLKYLSRSALTPKCDEVDAREDHRLSEPDDL
jgi:hypothetical protein